MVLKLGLIIFGSLGTSGSWLPCSDVIPPSMTGGNFSYHGPYQFSSVQFNSAEFTSGQFSSIQLTWVQVQEEEVIILSKKNLLLLGRGGLWTITTMYFSPEVIKYTICTFWCSCTCSYSYGHKRWEFNARFLKLLLVTPQPFVLEW